LRPGQSPHPLDRCIELGRVPNHEGKAAALRRNIANGDLGLAAAQLGGDFLFLGLQAGLGSVALVGLQQQLAAAARSRPRLICARGANFGQVATWAFGNTLGTAKAMPARMTSQIDQIFQRGKSSISRLPAWRTCSGRCSTST
jgi:hypothetical protein